MLTKQNKLDIYGLLCDEFSKNAPIAIGTLTSYLEQNGLSYQEFGYKNALALFKDLKEFLTIGNAQGRKESEIEAYLHDFVLPESSFRNNRNPHSNKKPKKESKPKEKKNDRKTAKPQKPEPAKPNPSPIPRADKNVIEKELVGALAGEKSYQKGQDYPLAMISKTLNDKGVSCHRFGFGKMKNMMALFPDFFRIHDVESKGFKQPWVSILVDFPSMKREEKPLPMKADVLANKNKLVPVAEDKKADNRKENVTKKNPRPQSERKPDPEAVKIADFYVPDKLLLSLKEMAALGLDDESLVKVLHADYEKAVADHTTERRKEGLVFPLSFLNRNSESLIGAIRKSDSNTDYAYFLSFAGTDKDKPKDYLRQMVHFNDFEESIDSLAKLAKKESWCYHNSKDKHIILKIYLQYTFYRLYTQKKILVDEKSGFVAFNTGLVTEDYDSIYGVMMLNQSETVKENFIFQGFTIAGSQGIGKIVVEHFSPLPKKATYIDDPSDLLPKEDMQIHTDYHHILLDNIDRLPVSFVSNICAPFPDCRKIVDQILKEKNDFRIQKLYASLAEKIQGNDFLYNLLRASLEISINKGIAMMHYDYRKVLPSFFPTRNVLSFMVPLTFGRNGNRVEAVLLIEKTASGNYQGQTILTLKQCYVNSRLISPLESTYLKPEEIED